MAADELCKWLEGSGFEVSERGEWKFMLSSDFEGMAVEELIEASRQLRGERGERNQQVKLNNGAEIFLKQYHHGGLLSSTGDVFYRSPVRFLKELRAAKSVYEACGQTPKPLGVFWAEEAEGYRGFYLARYVAHRPLGKERFEETQAREHMNEAGRLLGRMHQVGVDACDYHVGNLFESEQGQLMAVDFDPVNFGVPKVCRRAYRQHRFIRSLSKAGFSWPVMDAFLRGYHEVANGKRLKACYHLQRPFWWTKNRISDLIYYFKGA